MFFNVPFKEIHVNVKPTARTNKSLCMCLPGFYCEGTASCETESKVSGGNGTDSGGLLLEGCVVLKQKKASEEVLRMKRMMKRTEFVLALLFVFQGESRLFPQSSSDPLFEHSPVFCHRSCFCQTQNKLKSRVISAFEPALGRVPESVWFVLDPVLKPV